MAWTMRYARLPPGDIQGWRAYNHTPSRAAPPVGRHQLNTARQLHLLITYWTIAGSAAEAAAEAAEDADDPRVRSALDAAPGEVAKQLREAMPVASGTRLSGVTPKARFFA